MLSKTKKLLFLTTGLAGALVTSTAAGVALTSCTVEAVNSGGNGSSSDGITLPDTWYNKDINWSDATSLNNLIIDKQGFVYSNKYMTEIIAILPGYESSTLVIPSTVTSISGYNNVTSSGKTAAGAFEGLTSITNLKFAGNKITTIGARAFYGCTSLQNVVLPSSVTLIDSYAFQNCSALNSINLDNVQYIGTSAFNGAMSNVPTGTINLNLNKTVLISANAFLNATGIGAVDFSKNTTLTQVAEAAFSGCTGLAGDIDLSNASKLITIGSSSAPTTTGNSFRSTAISNVYLPSTSGLRTIALNSFYECSQLVTVGPKGTTGFTATESVSSINTNAFYGTKITSVDISQITATNPLQAAAFNGMAELASVNLGTKITTIPAACFMNCTALTSLTLPESITSISGGTPSFSSTTSSGPVITFTGTNYPAFYGSGLTSIDLSTITSYSTTTNATLNLPDTLFYNCPSLTTVTLKEGTTSIGQGAFAGTTALTSINTSGSTSSSTGYTATSTLTTVGQYAFWRSGISSVDISAITSSSYSSLAYLTFSECPNLTNIQLPSTIKTIASYAVNDTPKLTTVNFGDLALTSIDNYNFSNCALSEVDLSNSTIAQIPSTSTTLFKNLTSSTTVKLPSTLWDISASNTAFTYSETVTDNEGNQTTSTKLLNITFPNGFAPSSTAIGNFANNTLTGTVGRGNLNAHTMFSRVSGDLDLSTFSQLRSIGIRTFFGGPISSLTFNASTFANGKFGDNYQTSAGAYSYLGFLGPAKPTTGNNTLTYATESLPFGNMTNLNSITFKSFASATTTTANNALANTTSDTWNQVAKIISSFSKEAITDGSTTAVNLSDWDHQNIQATVQESDDTNVVTSVTLSSVSDSAATVTINSAGSSTLTYAGLTWTINVDNTNGTITISATDVNTYRVLNDSTGTGDGQKAFFNKTTNTVSSGDASVEVDVPNSSITVTLNVVPTASTSR